MEPQFNIAICGGGNLAHGCTACIGHHNPDYSIKLLSRRPQLWANQITGFTKGTIYEKFGDMVGHLKAVSNDAKEIVSDADVVLICSPAHTKNEILAQIKPYLKKGCLVGTVFGQGAFDIQANSILGEELIKELDITIFSLQYVPFICKVEEYGRSINIIGPKRCLYAAAYPPSRVHYVCNMLSQAFFIPAVPIPSFLNLTLCPSNQIIHPGRVYGYFKKFPNECLEVLKRKDIPLLYEGLDQASADEIELLDNEIQAIKRAINKKYPMVDLSQVMPMKDRICTMYKEQVEDPSTLLTVFRTNIGYRRVTFPLLPVEG
jgi:hypothetical protein